MNSPTHPISLAEVVPAGSPRPHRPTYARVEIAALEDNFRAFRNLAGRAAIMAVIKADAYGHGLLKCAQIFSELGADCFGVAFVEEGIALRQAGFRQPVLVLGGIVGSQISLFLEHDLDMTASSRVQNRSHRRGRARQRQTRPRPSENRHRHEPHRAELAHRR